MINYNVKNNFKNNNEDEIKLLFNKKLLNVIIKLENSQKELNNRW